MQEVFSWLVTKSYIPVRLHKTSTTARPFMHTPLTVRAYSYHHPEQANTKAARNYVN